MNPFHILWWKAYTASIQNGLIGDELSELEELDVHAFSDSVYVLVKEEWVMHLRSSRSGQIISSTATMQHRGGLGNEQITSPGQLMTSERFFVGANNHRDKQTCANLDGSTFYA